MVLTSNKGRFFFEGFTNAKANITTNYKTRLKTNQLELEYAADAKRGKP